MSIHVKYFPVTGRCKFTRTSVHVNGLQVAGTTVISMSIEVKGMPVADRCKYTIACVDT